MSNDSVQGGLSTSRQKVFQNTDDRIRPDVGRIVTVTLPKVARYVDF